MTGTVLDKWYLFLSFSIYLFSMELVRPMEKKHSDHISPERESTWSASPRSKASLNTPIYIRAAVSGVPGLSMYIPIPFQTYSVDGILPIALGCS